MVEGIVRHTLESKLLLGGHREPILLESLWLSILITTILRWKVRAERRWGLRLHESRTISPVHPWNGRTLSLIGDIHHLPHLLMHSSQIRVPTLRPPKMGTLRSTELSSEWNGVNRRTGVCGTSTRGRSILSVWMVSP